MIKIADCKCEHVFQDKTYGKNKRAFNGGMKQDNYKCTVCGSTRTIGK